MGLVVQTSSSCRPRSLSEYWGAVANRGLVSRARGERWTAMAPIVYGSLQRDSAT